MSDRICQTCRWWERVPFVPRYQVPFDTNRYVGECTLTEMEDGRPVHDQTRAFAADSEDYRASLLTQADFGCNQWEATP